MRCEIDDHEKTGGIKNGAQPLLRARRRSKKRAIRNVEKR
jgi:hypothetical protein